LLNKDFYHLSAGTVEVKSNTPNNVAFKVNGKSSHEKATSGSVSPPHPELSIPTSKLHPSELRTPRESYGGAQPQ
jgi:hypothetical protein